MLPEEKELYEQQQLEWEKRIQAINNSSQVNIELLGVDENYGSSGDLPINLLSKDLPKANLQPEDIEHLMEEYSFAIDLMQQGKQSKVEFRETLRDIMMFTRSIVELSRGYLGHGTFWAKTEGSFSGNIEQMIEQRKYVQQLLSSPTVGTKEKEKLKKTFGIGISPAAEGKLMDIGAGYNQRQEDEIRTVGKTTRGWY